MPLQFIKKLLRRKKKAPTTPEDKRDLLLPTVRTTATVRKLRESGLTDKEIEKLLGAKLSKS